MNEQKTHPVPFLECVARYAEELGNHAWAENLRHRLGKGTKRQSPLSDREKRPDRESDS